ncbi:MAG: hypothetical protein JRG82_09050 [Deltaproteobacteria bacterium]|nr:hypothetical protein [Deltaproteobacteria bacterium]
MNSRILALCAALLAASPAYAAKPALPFDEQTLDRIEVLNRTIADHYEELQTTASGLASRREITQEKLDAIEKTLDQMDRDLAALRRKPGTEKDATLRYMEEHRIEIKSRYLEALAEKHAIDVESTRAFEVHGSAILVNLERLARALSESSGLGEGGDPQASESAFYSLQRGTAVALTVLEDWGSMTREDPRFRALWATARVLNKNLKRAQAAEGVQLTVDLVRERTFVVRSLIDQSRALQSALDHQGLLLQVAAQNQMLHLHFNRLGVIGGLELPDLDLEDSTRRIIEDIEEESYVSGGSDYDDGLSGFDDCLHSGICR